MWRDAHQNENEAFPDVPISFASASKRLSWKKKKKVIIPAYKYRICL